VDATLFPVTWRHEAEWRESARPGDGHEDEGSVTVPAKASDRQPRFFNWRTSSILPVPFGGTVPVGHGR
jgi:hypothetical protein